MTGSSGAGVEEVGQTLMVGVGGTDVGVGGGSAVGVDVGWGWQAVDTTRAASMAAARIRVFTCELLGFGMDTVRDYNGLGVGKQ